MLLKANIGANLTGNCSYVSGAHRELRNSNNVAGKGMGSGSMDLNTNLPGTNCRDIQFIYPLCASVLSSIKWG